MLLAIKGDPMTNTNPYASNNFSPETEKLLAILVHVLAIPFEFFAPVIGYFTLKGKGPFITHHVRESLNFGITMLLVMVVLLISIVGWLLLWVPPIYWFIMRVIAAIKAAQGEFFSYPLTLRFVK
jgi:uncharacterized Tic20 family protein